MKTYSQCVSEGCKIVRAQMQAGGRPAPCSALFRRAALKVLRDDGEVSPDNRLVDALVEGIRTWWTDDLA